MHNIEDKELKGHNLATMESESSINREKPKLYLGKSIFYCSSLFLIAMCFYAREAYEPPIYYFFLICLVGMFPLIPKLLLKGYELKDVKPDESKWLYSVFYHSFLIFPPLGLYCLWQSPNIRYWYKWFVSLFLVVFIGLGFLLTGVDNKALNNLAYIKTTHVYTPYQYGFLHGEPLYVVFPKDNPEYFFWIVKLGPGTEEESEYYKKNGMTWQDEYYVMKNPNNFFKYKEHLGPYKSLYEAVTTAFKNQEFVQFTSDRYIVKDGIAIDGVSGSKLEDYLGNDYLLPKIKAVHSGTVSHIAERSEPVPYTAEVAQENQLNEVLSSSSESSTGENTYRYFRVDADTAFILSEKNPNSKTKSFLILYDEIIIQKVEGEYGLVKYYDDSNENKRFGWIEMNKLR